MSVSTEITRLETAKSDIASAITEKGVAVPSGTKLDGMATLIRQISGGAPEFNAIFEAPPYSHIFGTCEIDGTETNVSWNTTSATEFYVTLSMNATYRLDCELIIPTGILADGNFGTVTVSHLDFQTHIAMEKYSFIPDGAIYFYGWENPNWIVRTATAANYGTKASGGLTQSRFRTGTSTSSLGNTVTLDSHLQNDKEHHCLFWNYTDIMSGGSPWNTSRVYENIVDMATEAENITISSWSMYYAKNWTQTSSSGIYLYEGLHFTTELSSGKLGEFFWGGSANRYYNCTSHTGNNMTNGSNKAIYTVHYLSKTAGEIIGERYLGFSFYKPSNASAKPTAMNGYVYVIMQSPAPYVPPEIR